MPKFTLTTTRKNTQKKRTYTGAAAVVGAVLFFTLWAIYALAIIALPVLGCLVLWNLLT